MDFLTTVEAADLLRVPDGTLRYWRHLGTGPRSARLGRKVVYLRADLDAWIGQEVARTSRGGTTAQISASA
jgi:excisionase family DNA binding protein